MIRILSIDGGGIRGAIPAQILFKIESLLQRISGNSNARISDHFDLIAASGTGTITASIHLVPDVLSKTRPKYSAGDAVSFYMDRGAEIFDIPLSHRIRTANGLLDEKYPSDGLREVLKDYFDDCLLSDLIKPCLLSAYDLKKRKAQLFRKTEADTSGGKDFFMRDLLRATSATPTYFECAMISSKSGLHYNLMDGSIFANNPSQAAMAEGIRMTMNNEQPSSLDQVMLLSVGTGRSKKMHRYENARNWGMAEWSKPVIEAAAEGQSDMADFQLRNMFEGWGQPQNYIRISPALPEDLPSDIDEARGDHISALVEVGTDAVQEQEKELKQFLARLIKTGPSTQDQ